MRKHRWLAVALLVVVAAIFWGVERYRYRFVHSNPDLLQLLPANHHTLFYADVSTLRRAGYLKLLSGTKTAADYAAFIQATGFDYTRDLEGLAGASDGDQIWLVARGHFDWGKIHNYAANSRVQLKEIQPDVLALASKNNSDALAQIRPEANSLVAPSLAPVWLEPSHAALVNPATLPLPVRIFAISLQSAESAVLALESSRSADAAFLISLTATFRSPVSAGTARDQLVQDTALLIGELAREHQKPSRSDLTGLLSSGKFEASGTQLRALWPVNRELLRSLE